MDVNPSITVLQLDTNFPRLAGDIGNPETFSCPLEVMRIPGSLVQNIVTAQPDKIDIAPFELAAQQAKGTLIATSCGFLSPFQSALELATSKPIVTSALIALPYLVKDFLPSELMIVTFDGTKLNRSHLHGCPDYQSSIVGLPKDSHLRAVIEQDLTVLDRKTAEADVVQLVRSARRRSTRAILLECTNLPPYKAALMRATGLPVFDILSVIEAKIPTVIAPEFTGTTLFRGD